MKIVFPAECFMGQNRMRLQQIQIRKQSSHNNTEGGTERWWTRFWASRHRAFSKPSLVLCSGVLACLSFYWWTLHKEYEEKKLLKEQEKKTMQEKGRPKMGFFHAVDTEGQNVTDRDFRGKWLLVYFGFTNCPDICPEVLEKLSEMIDRCKDVVSIQPLFVTVDPFRDDPARIKKYLQEFHPKFVGLTGSQEQMKKIFATFGVYSRSNPSDEDGDYIVDHTIITYLVDPSGLVLDNFTRSQDQDRVYDLIMQHVSNFKPAPKDKPYSARFK